MQRIFIELGTSNRYSRQMSTVRKKLQQFHNKLSHVIVSHISVYPMAYYGSLVVVRRITRLQD